MIRKVTIWVLLAALTATMALMLLIRYGGLLEILWKPHSVPPLSRMQLRQALQEAGGGEALVKEVSLAVLQFGTNNYTHPSRLTNCPAISQMASLINGEIVALKPNTDDLPPYICMRRGSHFDYQFIYICGTELSPRHNGPKLTRIDEFIYFRNTSE